MAAGIGAASLVAATARADLTTVVAEDDLFALDGVTRLVDVPGYAGERVVNVYALFDNPDDQLVGVLGRPFDVVTGGGTTFINEPTFGDDRAPEQALVMAVPALNWDSFVTIGNKFDSPTSQLLLAPKFVGPNTSPWTMPSGWIAPPSVGSSGGFNEQNLIDVLFFWGTPDPMGDLNGDGLVDSADLTAALTGWGSGGVPAAQTVAGPMQRVLIARIVVAPGETVNFDMTVIGGDDGNFQANIVSFSTSNPACGPDAGPCNMGNGSPGCNDPACCELVCSLLPNCCDIDWDPGCAGEAINQGCAHLPGCMDGSEILEGEMCGMETNGGCNATPTEYVTATCGESYAGTSSVIEGQVDQDWYLIDMPAGGDLEVELKSEFAGVVQIIDGVAAPGEVCPGPVVVGVQGESLDCAPGVASATDLPPGLYCIIVQPAGKGDLSCDPPGNGYVMTPLPIPPVGPPSGGGECIPANRGGCCLPSGNCNVMLPEDCASAGGNFQGLLSTCSIPPCQACCLPDDSCMYTADEDECTNAGGTFQGVSVPGGGSAVKACCFDDGRCCRRLTEKDCEAEGGTFQDFNNCENCPKVDACPYDYDDDGEVAVTDLIEVITNWGAPYTVTDLIGVITNWGPCPLKPPCSV